MLGEQSAYNPEGSNASEIASPLSNEHLLQAQLFGT